MNEVDIGGWKLRVDPERTKQALAGSMSDAERCGCSPCRNFVAARPACFPQEFLRLLDRLGIDPKKDAQSCHIVRKRKTGLHLYEIDFYFAAEVVREAEDKEKCCATGGSFSYAIMDKILYRTSEFPDGFLALQCFPEIPWVLLEEEVTEPSDEPNDGSAASVGPSYASGGGVGDLGAELNRTVTDDGQDPQ